MTKQEAKEYILNHWKRSSGKRISEMLKHYWNLKNSPPDIVEEAKKIFNL